jgi:predicted nucleic acid-binding protein
MSGVVSNAGPLITLGKLNLLHLLGKLYSHVYISKVVYDEVIVNGIRFGCIDAFRAKLLINETLIVRKVVPTTVKIINAGIDEGEIETIKLAIGINSDLVLIDDWHARIEARNQGLTVKGSLGVLYSAYKADLINSKEFNDTLKEIAYRDDIWISEDLCMSVLDAASV